MKNVMMGAFFLLINVIIAGDLSISTSLNLPEKDFRLLETVNTVLILTTG